MQGDVINFKFEAFIKKCSRLLALLFEAPFGRLIAWSFERRSPHVAEQNKSCTLQIQTVGINKNIVC